MKALPSRIILLGALILISASAFGQSSTYQELHNFGGTVTLSNGSSGMDGVAADALVIDKQGDKFVGTQSGGLYNQGGVFELTAQGQYIDLHDFQTDADCTAMVIDPNGNLFGVTDSGGKFGGGTVWKLTPSGVYTVLHDLGGTITTANGMKGQDGIGPNSLILDKTGNLFGTCLIGGYSTSGTQSGPGMVFEYTAAGVYKDLHDCGGAVVLANGQFGDDGVSPDGCAVDSSGTLYGINREGNGTGGNLWKIIPSGTYADIHDFGGTYVDPSGNSIDDYGIPWSIVCDANGNVFGTCNGTPSAWEYTTNRTYKILHTFGDYFSGFAVMAVDSSGDIFGATAYSVWEITSAGAYYDLSDWSSEHDPGQVALDSSGVLYGVTGDGGQYGTYGDGVLYSVKPGPTSYPFLRPQSPWPLAKVQPERLPWSFQLQLLWPSVFQVTTPM